MTNERVKPENEICKDFSDHEFEEVYYGTKCKRCGLFYAYGCEPWAPDENPPPESYCEYCGKEFEDFSDLGCEHCDARHPHYGIIM